MSFLHFQNKVTKSDYEEFGITRYILNIYLSLILLILQYIKQSACDN